MEGVAFLSAGSVKLAAAAGLRHSRAPCASRLKVGIRDMQSLTLPEILAFCSLLGSQKTFIRLKILPVNNLADSQRSVLVENRK
jgi:hypothetical protein